MKIADRVLEYLSKDGVRGLTVRECEEKVGTTELRKCMCILRDRGYKVASIWETGKNRYGDPVRYKRYFIIGKEKI